MAMLVQWLVVAVIGLGALVMVARHFGLGVKRGGTCPGCNSCASSKKGGAQAPPPTNTKARPF